MRRLHEALGSVERFCADPLGRAAQSVHAVTWVPTAQLRISAFWGAPSVLDLVFARRALDAVLTSSMPAHAALVDARGLTELDEAIYGPHFAQIARRPGIAARVRRSAVVLENNPIGEKIRFYRSLVRLPYETEAFHSPVDALAWLGLGRVAASVEQDLARWMAAGSESDLLHRLRAALRRPLEEGRGTLPLRTLAEAVGVSTRTVQRTFQGAGTSYRAELGQAQVERATELLRGTDLKLEAIAREVGLQRTASLNRLFLATLGVRAGEWRRNST